MGNACPVVDRMTGTIWLPFSRDNQRVLLIKSTDDGKTWGKIQNMTRKWKKKDWILFAPSPQSGIALADGTLVKSESLIAESRPTFLFFFATW